MHLESCQDYLRLPQFFLLLLWRRWRISQISQSDPFFTLSTCPVHDGKTNLTEMATEDWWRPIKVIRGIKCRRMSSSGDCRWWGVGMDATCSIIITIVIIIMCRSVRGQCRVAGGGPRVARWRWWRPAVILATLSLPRAVPATRLTHLRDTWHVTRDMCWGLITCHHVLQQEDHARWVQTLAELLFYLLFENIKFSYKSSKK